VDEFLRKESQFAQCRGSQSKIKVASWVEHPERKVLGIKTMILEKGEDYLKI
jgi:hypothetical protein